MKKRIKETLLLLSSGVLFTASCVGGVLFSNTYTYVDSIELSLTNNDHSHSDDGWVEISDFSSFDSETDGKYYLSSRTTTVSETITISADISLCLSNRTLSRSSTGDFTDYLFDITQGSLSIYDCQGRGIISGNSVENTDGSINVHSSTSFYMYGGHLDEAINNSGTVLISGGYLSLNAYNSINVDTNIASGYKLIDLSEGNGYEDSNYATHYPYGIYRLINSIDDITICQGVDYSPLELANDYVTYSYGEEEDNFTVSDALPTELGTYYVQAEVPTDYVDGANQTYYEATTMKFKINIVEHVNSNEYAYDETYHWFVCENDCGYPLESEAHTFGEWGTGGDTSSDVSADATTGGSTSSEGEEQSRSCGVCGYTETQTITTTSGDDSNIGIIVGTLLVVLGILAVGGTIGVTIFLKKKKQKAAK